MVELHLKGRESISHGKLSKVTAIRVTRELLGIYVPTIRVGTGTNKILLAALTPLRGPGTVLGGVALSC